MWKRRFNLHVLLFFISLCLSAILIATGVLLNVNLLCDLKNVNPFPKSLQLASGIDEDENGSNAVAETSNSIASYWDNAAIVLDSGKTLAKLITISSKPATSDVGLPEHLENKLKNVFTFRDTMRTYLTKDGTFQTIRVKVIGSQDMIDRDFPLVKRGYLMASSLFTFTIIPEARYNKDDPNYDLVLCFSLTSCAPPTNDIYKEYFNTNPGMRVNRAPKLKGVLWLKHNYCKTLPKWLAAEIAFPCWVLPDQMKELLQHVQKRDAKDKWILKPWSGGGGDGIKVVSGPYELTEFLDKAETNYYIVQPFLVDPLLINDRKMDLRVYVLLTSTYPFRGYVHERGLVRFAAQPYSATSDSFSQSQFLTNINVNKKESNVTMEQLTWPFTNLYEVLGPARARRTRLGMDRVIALLLLAAEFKFPRNSGCEKAEGACYHLLGFDLILSSKEARPKIIEVNGEPSFVAASGNNIGDVSHYDETKIAVARDVAKIVFGPLTPQSKLEAQRLVQELNEPAFLDYAVELTREQQAITEFRPCYPSPVAAVFEEADVSFVRLLSTAAAPSRLELHNTLKRRELNRLVLCYRDPNCTGGLKSVLDDLIGEGFKIVLHEG